jgi:hypothetical protein
MPRRPAPTPLRLHPGPTPPRNYTKFTLPIPPQQSFYPTTGPSVTEVKPEIKYFRRRGHARSSSSGSTSSEDSDDDSASSGIAFGDSAKDPLRHRINIAVEPMAKLPPVMTRGPRPANDNGRMTMPEFKASSGLNPGVRTIQMMGPWEYSKLRLSESEISAMIAAPPRAVANPCPVSW